MARRTNTILEGILLFEDYDWIITDEEDDLSKATHIPDILWDVRGKNVRITIEVLE